MKRRMVLFVVVCGALAGQGPAAEEASVFQPDARGVRQALEQFAAFPKEAALQGYHHSREVNSYRTLEQIYGHRITAEVIRQQRREHEAGDAPPDAAWVNFWMGLDRERVYDMIPTENPLARVPNSVQGSPVRDGNIKTLKPVWDKPNVFRSRVDGREWGPGLTVTNPGTGEDVTIDDDGDGWVPPPGFPNRGRFHFKAAYRLYGIRLLTYRPYAGHYAFPAGSYRPHASPIYALAYAYAVTGEQKYADRVLLILNRLAENYRHYEGKVGARWSVQPLSIRGYIEDHNFECAYITNCALAYDLIFDALDDADGVVQFFNERGDADYNHDGEINTEDLRYNIERNLFGYMWEFLQRSSRRIAQNKRLRQYRSMMHMAMIFRNDTIMRHAVDGPSGWTNLLVGSTYREGRWHEDSSNYAHLSNLHMLGMYELVRRYRGRQWATNGIEFDPAVRELIDAVANWPSIGFCDGRQLFIGDAGNPRGPVLDEPDGPLSDTLLGHEVGLTVMRLGDDHRTRKHVLLYHSNSGAGHGHRGQLKMKVIGFGYDFSADLGYPANFGSDKRKQWTNNTISHPTVLVDGEPQKPQRIVKGRDGSVASADIFARNDWAQVAAAYSHDAYPQSDIYHRTVALVQVEPDRHFVIDIFRVRGGATHDYSFHSLGGPQGERFEISCADALDARPGTLAGPTVDYATPMSNGYSYIKDVRAGAHEDNLTATWWPSEDRGIGYHLHALASPGQTVFTGKGEGKGPIRRSPLDTYVILRRRGDDGAQRDSIFVTVHEPFQGDDLGLTLKRGEAFDPDAPGMPVSLTVTTRDGETFDVFSQLGDRAHDGAYRGGAVFELTGPRGALRVNRGNGPRAGEIVAVDYGDRAMRIATDADLSDAAGEVIYIQHPAYTKTTSFTIASVERAGDNAWRLTTRRSPLLARNTLERTAVDPPTLVSPYNMEKTSEHQALFDGKVVVPMDQPDRFARVRTVETAWNTENDGPNDVGFVYEYREGQHVTLRDAAALDLFEPGEHYGIYDYGPGDRCYISRVESGAK